MRHHQVSGSAQRLAVVVDHMARHGRHMEGHRGLGAAHQQVFRHLHRAVAHHRQGQRVHVAVGIEAVPVHSSRVVSTQRAAGIVAMNRHVVHVDACLDVLSRRRHGREAISAHVHMQSPIALSNAGSSHQQPSGVGGGAVLHRQHFARAMAENASLLQVHIEVIQRNVGEQQSPNQLNIHGAAHHVHMGHRGVVDHGRVCVVLDEQAVLP
mmetsp:Transcript_19522/g.32827  ORF Transcript_19522/g.32827 Transcript_19522/m.32827 type:complete len:210 (-) Transcript_19522:4-633(-)